MTEKELPIIEFNERFDKLTAEQLKCPGCGVKYMMHVPHVFASCKKCGSKYQTDFKQDIYTKSARKLNSALAWKNGVIIKATSAYEQDIIHVQKHFQEMYCWDVSEIECKDEDHKRCEKCGICLNCFTCKDCDKSFSKDPHHRKQKCPHCNSNKFIKTYFKEANISDKNKNIRLCPECDSEKIIMTRSKTKTKCHLCSSKQLGETIKETIFTLTIKRKKGYRKEDT